MSLFVRTVIVAPYYVKYAICFIYSYIEYLTFYFPMSTTNTFSWLFFNLLFSISDLINNLDYQEKHLV